MQYLVVICALFYLLSGHGCQMPESRGTVKQSSPIRRMPNPNEIYLGESGLAQDIRAYREMQREAARKAYQMYLDKQLQDFQKSLDNPQPRKKGW